MNRKEPIFCDLLQNRRGRAARLTSEIGKKTHNANQLKERGILNQNELIVILLVGLVPNKFNGSFPYTNESNHNNDGEEEKKI